MCDDRDTHTFYYCDDFCLGPIFYMAQGVQLSVELQCIVLSYNELYFLAKQVVDQICSINLTIPTAIPPQTAYPVCTPIPPATPLPPQTAYPAEPAQTLPPMPTPVPPATPLTPEPAQTAYPAETVYLVREVLTVEPDEKPYWFIGGLGLVAVIEAILIGYILCTNNKKPPEKPQETHEEDQTIQIPRNIPDFTVTLNNEEPSLELSDEYFLAMEEEEVSEGNYLVH